VSVDEMMVHLTNLQGIADANGDNRALGTPGYDASVDYVAQALRSHGFEVQTPEFEVRLPFAEKPVLTVGAASISAKPLEWTVGTAPQGVTGPLVAARVEDSPGCTASDYDGMPVAGAVVLVDRGECQLSAQGAAAAERGAVAVIVANDRGGDEMTGTLGARGDVKIPAVGITRAAGARLRAEPGNVTLKLEAGVDTERTRNVIAQTRTGSSADVVMVGAHLDSVDEGPGINDNGSGVAALLETAAQLGSSPKVNNAVRFAFWGAEEVDLNGSMNYVESLDEDELKDISLYLNFDMIASPNPGYFLYDGDQSLPPGSKGERSRMPEGSAGIERTLAAYLENAGKPPEDAAFDGASDYDGFILAGIPVGWLFTGADTEMSEEQARRWGGQAGEAFDPNYHTATDTLEHVNRTALEINGGAIAYVVGRYAQDQRGRNGLPVRDDRTRHVVADS
jgi:Zn-dependent M28 family amino/carboxypeptidase